LFCALRIQSAGFAVLTIIRLLAIYFAAGAPGTVPADFGSMAGFP
jgi:hypothetical protein